LTAFLFNFAGSLDFLLEVGGGYWHTKSLKYKLMRIIECIFKQKALCIVRCSDQLLPVIIFNLYVVVQVALKTITLPHFYLFAFFLFVNIFSSSI